MRFSIFFVFFITFVLFFGLPAASALRIPQRVSVEVTIDGGNKIPADHQMIPVKEFEDSQEWGNHYELNAAAGKIASNAAGKFLKTASQPNIAGKRIYNEADEDFDGDADSASYSNLPAETIGPKMSLGSYFTSGTGKIQEIRQKMQRSGAFRRMNNLPIQVKEIQSSRGAVNRVVVEGQLATRENCAALRAAGVPCTFTDNSPIAIPLNAPNGANQRELAIRQAIATSAIARALPGSIRACGTYVRLAIEDALRPVLFPRQRYASDFGTSLLAINFRSLGTNLENPNIHQLAQTGDVIIIRRFGSHTSGHAVIKVPETLSGGVMKGWASDFLQRRFNPYSQAAPFYTLYRYGRS